MLTRPTISLNLSAKTNADLASFAATLSAGLNGNLSYPTPNPPLIDFTAAITDFNDAVTAWGTVHNRGSHAQKLAVDSTRTILVDTITALANYCENTTPYDAAAFTSAGFDVRLVNVPVGLLPVVQDFHQFISRTVPSGAVKLKWKRPLGIKPGAVNSYKVIHSLTADINAAEFLGITTKTTFTDLEAASRPSNFYWVIPVNTAGNGGIADVVQGFPMGPVVS